MAMLKKELTLYERDEKGELIPQKRKLDLSELDEERHPELKDMEVMILPLTRGELKKIFGLSGLDTDAKEEDKDGDAEIIVKNCKNPAYTLEELKYAKPVIVRGITGVILAESGVQFDKKQCCY